jgi:NADH-quinone oxidoreductase subunit J
MSLYDIFFYIFAAVTLVSGFIVVTSKNIVYSAFSLLFTFFGVTGIYVLLAADFIAIVQLLVYVGGILILMLFGVMLTNRLTNVEIRTGTLHIIPATIGVGLFAGALYSLFVATDWKTKVSEVPNTTIYKLGNLLISDYALIFELLGVILLIALIGAATIARKDAS